MHRGRTTILSLVTMSLLCVACAGDAETPGGSASGAGASSAGGAGGTGGGSACSTTVTPKPGTVVTDRGPVTGVEAGATWSFRNVPYAAPPVGDLRWKAPREHACWQDDLDASKFGNACPQIDAKTMSVVGDEDCLALNVWAPKDADKSAVLFFVHGGGNTQGSAVQATADGSVFYDGQALAEATGNVVVTINYRLGALGFVAHPELTAESDEGSSGNYGNQDQIAALRWVHDNIASFGGDPEHVLLFGESAGALDTCILLTSPLAKGLFSAALMESGGCVAKTKADAEAFGAKLVQAAGCPAGDFACMRDLPASAVVKAIVELPDVAGKQSDYQPSIDGYVVTGDPLEVIAAGGHNHVPFVIGSNSEETGQVIAPMTEAEYEAKVHGTFGVALGDQVLAKYPAAAYPTPRDAYVAVSSDAKFICTARKVARAVSKTQTEPVYRYFFTQPLENAPKLAPLGAFHGLELVFVFGHLTTGGYPPSAGDKALSTAIMGYWGRIAATGKPDGDGSVAWPTYDAATDPYLQLAIDIAADEGVRTEQCDFWDSVIP